MDPMTGGDRTPRPGESGSGAFAPSGKIMLGAIVVLFFAAFLALHLHLYARWSALRRRPLVFAAAPPSSARGLDPALLDSIPVRIFSSSGGGGEAAAAECAVCLSEFEEGEKIRSVPRCRHGFHVECIDMWFHSHATCPLCRSAVDAAAAPPSAEPEELLAPSGGEGSSSGVEALSVEVEASGEGILRGGEAGSPGGDGEFKSPEGWWIESLRRLKSRGSPAEPDLERGEAAPPTPTPAAQ